MKNKSIIDKFIPLWEGGKSVERGNAKVGFCIRNYVVNQLNAAFQKDKTIFSEQDKDKFIKMVTELKETKGHLQPEDLQCTEEDYQEFLNTFFTNLDYEDRHDTVTIKTSSKFRLMAGFIDVLTTFGPLSEDMKKCKKYCAFKAVDIFKALKRGEVPKRGGPKEEENPKEKEADDELSKEIDKMSTNDNPSSQPPMNNNIPPQNHNTIQSSPNIIDPFAQLPPSNQGMSGGFSNPYANPYASQLPSNPLNEKKFSNGQIGTPTSGPSQNPNPGFNNPYAPKPQQPQVPPTQPKVEPKQPPVQPKVEPKQPPASTVKPLLKPKEKPSRIVKDKVNYYEPVGPRTTKVTQDKKNPNMKKFEMKYGDLTMPVPVAYKTINYFKLIDNTKKNNVDAYKAFKKGRIDMTLNLVEDSLEYLSYVDKQ